MGNFVLGVQITILVEGLGGGDLGPFKSSVAGGLFTKMPAACGRPVKGNDSDGNLSAEKNYSSWDELINAGGLLKKGRKKTVNLALKKCNLGKKPGQERKRKLESASCREIKHGFLCPGCWTKWGGGGGVLEGEFPSGGEVFTVDNAKC